MPLAKPCSPIASSPSAPASCPPRIRHSAGRRSCPHCGSSPTEAQGSFTRKDGSREPRRLCRGCGRTFNQHTGTPLQYLKLRHQWAGLGEAMARVLTIRQTAATLGIHTTTAFRWRHRLLAALSGQPRPVLTGQVLASEAYIPYSEKGRLDPRPTGPANSPDDPAAHRFCEQPRCASNYGAISPCFTPTSPHTYRSWESR